MNVQPYLLVPKLIPQPTWGGQYIAQYKHLDSKVFGSIAIGQSYELASDSQLSTVLTSQELPIEIANASDGQVQEIVGDRSSMFTLQSLIDQDPIATLGKKVVDTFGKSMVVLIKFTQAKGNSFQVHVRPGFPVGNWKPKPESWYFFEAGKATLGLKSPVQIEAYKKTCTDIEQKALELSKKISAKELSAEQGRQEFSTFIASHDPFAFVNTLAIEQDALVDLSSGGIHHSWEEGDDIPQGNIVYEVQLNVMDKDCTLRSFDKGKIGDDGSLRPIHIDDYFAALDVSEDGNDPARYMKKKVKHSEAGCSVAKLFSTLMYSSVELEFSREYKGPHTETNPQESFHHLFVRDGDLDLRLKDSVVHASKGSSLLIPANTGAYTLQCSSTATVIKTWI